METPAEDAASAVSPVGQSPLVDLLRRWEESGAVWQVAPSATSTLTIVLLRCDGGEEVDRVVSADPDLAAYVGGRSSSED